ncbi:MAG: hypothetical protein A2908_02500 [Candidatus Staskawiczbacteria bacterium RIFCSPLOWO2_01_FULL_38_12b]|uniref:Transcription regulator AsnC/Lrp ligand binding domain-containing protein n=1 Tax=Candidatus Staskawiczbacteria bacterium RIFCSPLOWO2_01_FULL_38_12b TaxID=1802214 RepID=A0A1G2IB11_9BACT|nr:MAG: hypothetical protein A2908_02500 [Candidatus Staskawiczbacteria bacterium RIFCSPLOWO2_01_FULL_38_12b]
MTNEEVLQKANEIVNQYGLMAEFLSDAESVGVGGDCRTYTKIIVLFRPPIDHKTLASLSTKISNVTGINRVTFELARK